MRVVAKLGSAGRGFTSQCTQKLGGWKFANLRDGRGRHSKAPNPPGLADPGERETNIRGQGRPWLFSQEHPN
jgi:hypothetical protein